MKKKSSKASKILRFFCTIVLYFTVTASAAIPVVYYAAALAGAALFTYFVQSSGNGRNIYLYNRRPGTPGGGPNFDWLRNIVRTSILAIPSDSQNPGHGTGVQVELQTPVSAIRQQVQTHPSQYPNISNAILDQTPTGMSQGSWGTGTEFDPDKLPNPGDIITTSDGNTMKVKSVTGCTTLAYSRSPGFSRLINNGTRMEIWTGCSSQTGSPGGPSSSTTNRGIVVQLQALTPEDSEISDEQWTAIFEQNPDEVVQAQRDLYQQNNGTSATGSGASRLPGNASTGQIVMPGTDTTPTANEIIDAVQQADAIAHPDQENVPASQQTQTTTTREQGQATVSIDPETGARTITIPTTVTVRDTQGNIISQQTEYFIGTYPANATLPESVQAAMEGAINSETGELIENTQPPLNLTKPDLVEIDLTPLMQAANVMHDKFPFSLLASITDFLTSLYVEPQTPEFEMSIAGFDFDVSLVLLDNFALWWRRFLRLIAMAYAAYYAIRICFM